MLIVCRSNPQNSDQPLADFQLFIALFFLFKTLGMLAYNELVCGLNRPNAHSHPADLSVLISPKDAPSSRARVRHLCEEFFLLSLIETHLIWIKIIPPSFKMNIEIENFSISALCNLGFSFHPLLSTRQGNKVKLCKFGTKP